MDKKLLVVLILCFILLVGCEFHIGNVPTNTNNIETGESGNQNLIIDLGNSISKEKSVETPVYTEVKVSTAKDLFQNIKSNTRIILTDDYYNISYIDPAALQSEHIFVEDSFDGYEYVICGIDNFEICADANVLPEIVSESSHANVISLNNCNNFKLNGVVVGHEVQKGSCTGGVIKLESCSNVEINNCHLYGCGTYGIVANEVKNVKVNNSEIYECTYGLIDLDTCNNFAFNNCTFKDSQEFTMFEFMDCNDIQFNNCTVTGNTSIYESCLIGSYNSLNISFTKCLFENNEYEYLCSADDDIKFISCKGKDVNYEKRYYPDYSDQEYGD